VSTFRGPYQCEQPYNNRCSTTYTLQSPDNDFRSYYQANSNDQSLPLYFPNGTTILKQKGRLSYEINGQENNDFPIYFYLICSIIGGTLVIGGLSVFVVMVRATFSPSKLRDKL
jgi:hypothetical protein